MVVARTGARDAADYACPRGATAVRLIRVTTPNGKIPGLMTSLFDVEHYPAAEFAALYYGRWRIEASFKRLKHRLGLEHTLGLFGPVARQDFGAKAIGDNQNARAGGQQPMNFSTKNRKTRSIVHKPSTRSSDHSDGGGFWPK